jgi:16S rRNA (uracil1498-N3)-methyltransferase
MKNQYSFYAPFNEGEIFTLHDKEQVFQISKVLRMKRGDKMTLLNGEGAHLIAEILEITKEDVRVKKIKVIEEKSYYHPIYLAVGAVKKEKLKIILKQATEMGVAGIFIVGSERSQVSLKSLEEKKENFLKIIKESLEQSMNFFLPKLEFFSSWKDLCESPWTLKADIYVGHHEGETCYFKHILSLKKEFCKSSFFLVGVEGGFSTKEIDIFKNRKASFVLLAPSILRVETACIVGVTYLHTHFLRDPK